MLAVKCFKCSGEPKLAFWRVWKFSVIPWNKMVLICKNCGEKIRVKRQWKPWEKWLWGIAFGFILLTILLILLSKEGIKITKNNQITYISRGEALIRFIPIWLVFFGLIWLIAKKAKDIKNFFLK